MADLAPERPTLWQSNTLPPRILRVTDLNRRVRALLDGDPTLADVWVEGEVSTPSFPPSGHCFFPLKDAGAQVRAIICREELGRSAVRPQHGMAVICHGRVRAYEPQGIYQLYVESLTPAGAGDLHARYEQLRARLAAEGLVDADRKRPLPRWPRRIGVVTSPMGAVWQDIRNVVRRRYPLVELVLSPTAVQGEAAAPGMVVALKRVFAQRGIDLVILARGGGSLEDLWAFNDERVVRTLVTPPGSERQTSWTAATAPSRHGSSAIAPPSTGCVTAFARSARTRPSRAAMQSRASPMAPSSASQPRPRLGDGWRSSSRAACSARASSKPEPTPPRSCCSDAGRTPQRRGARPAAIRRAGRRAAAHRRGARGGKRGPRREHRALPGRAPHPRRVRGAPSLG